MPAPALRFGTIRFRITAIAAIAVAAVLTIVAVALITLLRRELFTNLDNSLEQRADTYQTSFFEEDDEDMSVLLNTNDEDRAAQLVGADGEVIGSTPNLAGAPPLGRPDTAEAETTRSTTIAELEDDAYRVLSRPIETASGPAVLHVAQNIDDLNDTVFNLTVALTIAVPTVVAILAALVWWLVGRTLLPVELIRAEVADISGTDLRRRLQVPDHADEIARLASTMNGMLDRIDGAGRRQRQFVADASHELRTPLTRIRTELEVDQNRPELADPAKTNAALLEEAIDMQQLLDDLLFLARSDEHQHLQHRVPTDLDDIVLQEVQRQRLGTGIRIDTSAVSAAHLAADPGQLTRVVRNLLGNAVRHAAETVTVSLGESDAAVRLAIADDGPGVPREARRRIFERFGRADDARTRAEGGTGLGLAIVRDIVHRHRGTVRYDDQWQGGARFVVELPSGRSPQTPPSEA